MSISLFPPLPGLQLRLQRMALAVLIGTPLAAAAQTGAASSEQSATARAAYQSAFENYRPFEADEDQPAAGWRAANEEIGRLGGHMGHVRETEPATPQASEQPKAAEASKAPAADSRQAVPAASTPPASSAPRPMSGHQH